MGLKEKLDNHPVLIIGGTAIGSALATLTAIGVIFGFPSRDTDRQQVLDAENSKLKTELAALKLNPAAGTVFAPASDLAGSASHFDYDEAAFHLDFSGCQRTTEGAECRLVVTSKRKVNWWYTKNNALKDLSGAGISANWMSIGGEGQSLDTLTVIGKGVTIEPNNQATIIYRFQGEIDPKNIQSLVIGLRNGGSTLNIRPVQWN